jgi:hypothetical protein
MAMILSNTLMPTMSGRLMSRRTMSGFSSQTISIPRSAYLTLTRPIDDGKIIGL